MRISNVTPGASQMVISKIGIFDNNSDNIRCLFGSAISIPDITATVSGPPETYTFPAPIDSCGFATDTRLESGGLSFISIMHDD